MLFQFRRGIFHRDAPLGQLEHFDVVYMVPENDQLLVFQTVAFLEFLDGLVLGGPMVVDGQPMPSPRVDILVTMGFNPGPVLFLEGFFQGVQLRDFSNDRKTNYVLGEGLLPSLKFLEPWIVAVAAVLQVQVHPFIQGLGVINAVPFPIKSRNEGQQTVVQDGFQDILCDSEFDTVNDLVLACSQVRDEGAVEFDDGKGQGKVSQNLADGNDAPRAGHGEGKALLQ